jgi:hypothetical protein
MSDTFKEPAEKKPQWIWPALAIALFYRPLDLVGAWLLNGYTSFFQALCQSLEPWVPRLFAADTSAAKVLPTGSDVTDGGVFLILCWLLYAHWPKQTDKQRRAVMRRWLRRPFSQAMQTLLSTAMLPFLTYWYTDFLQQWGMLAHPFAVRYCFGAFALESRGFTAWQQHRGRAIARRCRKIEPKRTILDNLVS